MNTINLLDKLELPVKIGLDGEDLLFHKKTIMDAYLSAASLEFNRQLFGLDNTAASMSFLDLKEAGGVPALPQEFDLFTLFTPEIDSSATVPKIDNLKTPYDLANVGQMKPLTQLCQDGSSQGDTEIDSSTKIEKAEKVAPKPKRGKRKVEKVNIEEFVADERRRLLKKLESGMNRIIFKRRIKNTKRDPKVSVHNYRGSKYWGVSKNKSKWQVGIGLLQLSKCNF